MRPKGCELESFDLGYNLRAKGLHENDSALKVFLMHKPKRSSSDPSIEFASRVIRGGAYREE